MIRPVTAPDLRHKLFPKTNSFFNGQRQPLAPSDEFVGKSGAIKDTQKDDDFCVVARVESLIVGAPLEDALLRAEAYHAAGADAVLIHSRSPCPAEVLAFMRRWDRRCPVVIVPTRYFTAQAEAFATAGFSLVIWAYHLVRSCITSMQRVAATVWRERAVAGIESSGSPAPAGSGEAVPHRSRAGTGGALQKLTELGSGGVRAAG